MANHPPFCNLILHIVEWSAKKQVVRIDAGFIVAGVTDVHAFRDGAKMQFIRNPVRVQRLPVERDGAVPTLRLAVAPQEGPALIGSALVHMTPEPFRKRHRRFDVGLMAEDVLLGFTYNPAIGATCHSRDGSGLTTPAHAKSTRVGADFQRSSKVMPFYEAALLTRVLRCWKGLSATTFAEFWGIIGAHKKFTFLVSKPRTPQTSLGNFYWRSTPLFYHI